MFYDNQLAASLVFPIFNPKLIAGVAAAPA